MQTDVSTGNLSKTQFIMAAQKPAESSPRPYFWRRFYKHESQTRHIAHDIMQIALMRASPADEFLRRFRFDGIRSAACSLGRNFFFFSFCGRDYSRAPQCNMHSHSSTIVAERKMILSARVACWSRSKLKTKEQCGHARSNSCAEIFCFYRLNSYLRSYCQPVSQPDN